MKRLLPTTLILLTMTLPAFAAGKVEVVKKGSKLELVRDGKPYLIKGAGGDIKNVELLAKSGGNSIRTWGIENLGATLDRAQKAGVTVTAGFWIKQVRQGNNFTDQAEIGRMQKQVRETVAKFKDHPALLCWALGNEMEDGPGKNLNVWKEINALAKICKEVDPNHPTMTVVAEIGGDKVKNFMELCPDVDILGINTYAGAASVANRYRSAGGKKAFAITEFGPAGIWETKKGPLGSYLEQTSTEKAEVYRNAYKSAVLGADDLCVGSYVFLWGQKQEVTHTWFSMILDDGTRMASVDAMTELWTGKPPTNKVPVIKSFNLKGNGRVKAGEVVEATVDSSDPENDPLTVEWALIHDPGKYGSGGDREAAPKTYAGAVTKSDKKSASITMPADKGFYRIFVTIKDGKGGGAVANLPLLIE